MTKTLQKNPVEHSEAGGLCLSERRYFTTSTGRIVGFPERTVGLVGAAGSGKDEVAKILVRSHKFVRVAFADELKMEVWRCLASREVPQEASLELRTAASDCFATGIRNPFEKPTPPELRKLLQEWGMWRREQDPSYWIQRLEKFAFQRPNPETPRLVISDMRFENELEWLGVNRGEVWQVRREGIERMGHASEDLAWSVIPGAVQIDNSGTINDLRRTVNDIVCGKSHC
jgi:hypothetical protein